MEIILRNWTAIPDEWNDFRAVRLYGTINGARDNLCNPKEPKSNKTAEKVCELNSCSPSHIANLKIHWYGRIKYHVNRAKDLLPVSIKSNRAYCRYYQGISLLHVSVKLFASHLLNRLMALLDRHLTGFRRRTD